MFSKSTYCTLKNCDQIWDNPPSTQNYKYLEMPILIIWSISYNSGRETDTYMKFVMIL